MPVPLVVPMDIEFRPCPSHEGYSASLCGIVKRDKPRSDGTPFYLKPNARSRKVALNGEAHFLDRVVHDAWGDLAPPITSTLYNAHKRPKLPKGLRSRGPRPRSSYPDGMVLTVAELIELRRTRPMNC